MASDNPIFSEQQLQQETWKPIPTWEGIYEASSMGRVKRVTPTLHSTGPRIRTLGQQAGQRYLEIMLTSGRRRTKYDLHYLIASAFLGPRPDGYHVNHKNGNKKDNRIANLEYVTAGENTRHSIKMGFHDPKTMNVKLTPEQICAARDPLTDIPRMATEIGVHKSTLYNVRNGKSFKGVT